MRWWHVLLVVIGIGMILQASANPLANTSAGGFSLAAPDRRSRQRHPTGALSTA